MLTGIRSFSYRNWMIAIHDAVATAVAVLLSFFLRFDGENLLDRLPLLLWILPYFVVFSFFVCYAFQLTTTKWRFISIPDLLNIIRAASVLTLALLVMDYIFLAPNVYGSFFLGKTTIVIYWVLEVFLLSGSRIAYRYFRYTRTRNKAHQLDAAPAVLIGRAADAEVLLRGIESGAVKRLWPVGILSPARSDRGQTIRGIPVLGGIDDLPNVVEDFAHRKRPIERVVMTPSAFEADAKPEAVLMRARKLGLAVSRLPSLGESRDTPRLSPVAVEDLLLRPSVDIDYGRLENLLNGKSIVVTGGGGSIGLEMCDRVTTFGAARLLVIENSEPALYAAMEALSTKITKTKIDGHIADIRDRARIFQLIIEFQPDLVFHAAALKHVPILERDWGEGVKTNIFGSVNVADAARAANAQAMVMISTDKAIEPVSMLGLTKRFAELYCQGIDRELSGAAGDEPAMRLISVRFGNVLASNGSVVPKFKAQIEAGGPVTVTHPDMVRYFMTIREACDLVITAATHALNPQHADASVFVLSMGQPVKIVDLADRMIRLSGLQPGYDIDIVFTGVRPGERMHEILFAEHESFIEIGLPGVVAARPKELPLKTLRQWLTELEKATTEGRYDCVVAILKDAVPEYQAGDAAQDQNSSASGKLAL
ncbi:NAD-dependent epimerase/dehydratase [Rhodopseudomonas palustris HaA2]|uniref:NAD-dependent epimerase/dehydratase n=1 Tax=Rhodopseudomonas palustris (strain HaA2) TaxID=316058 RepID=Q2IZP6_RHOP2|nr:nucleoside-diphosphate sugar epimerase/dehydratase [Rhodopseudomonas palustris]ABD06314.1 NAD-dependent epimerase/dehydratase [Rhodopseudomonas palustris HaA2]